MTETTPSNYSNGFLQGVFGVVGFDFIAALAMSGYGTPLTAIGLALFIGQFFYIVPIVVCVCFKRTRNIAWGMLTAASVCSLISLGMCFGGMFVQANNSPLLPSIHPTVSQLNRLNQEPSTSTNPINRDFRESESITDERPKPFSTVGK